MIDRELARKEIMRITLDSIGDEPPLDTLRKIFQSRFADPDHSLLQDLEYELDGFGPLTALLNEEQVTEIFVNAYDVIFYEKAGLCSQLQGGFCSNRSFERFVRRLLHKIDKVADSRHPIADGVLDDGTRVHIVVPPITESTVVTLRRHRFSQWRLDDLLERGMFSSRQMELLKVWVTERKNFLICGPTGSGKTTLLRALLFEVAENERVITIEDTKEIGPINKFSANLGARVDPENIVPAITLESLLKNSLRMRPDRIVVGEVRGAEALVLLDALSTGHAGSICSLHADDPHQALRRLESLVLRAAPHWNSGVVRQLIFDALDGIIVVQRKEGKRSLKSISLIDGLESFGILIDPVEVF